MVVTGGGGQVGRALQRVLPEATFLTRAELDVTDAAAVDRAVSTAGVVVHTAALTNVDECERRPGDAAAVNDRGTEHVAGAARRHGARVILLSTDYVFAGDRPPYSEDDERAPVNVYGRTKAAAEDHLDPERDLVVRTSWVFGGARNFVRAIVEAARTTTPRVVDDQVGRPTAAADLARALAFLVAEAAVVGRLHVSGDGAACSRADLADRALEGAGSPVRVERVDSAAYAAHAGALIAPRPPNTTLSLERARALGVPLVDWRTSLDEYVKGLA